MNEVFFKEILIGYQRNLLNNYGNNYDYYRFGYKKVGIKIKLISYINRFIRFIYYRGNLSIGLKRNIDLLEGYYTGYQNLYNILEDNKSKTNLLHILLFKLLGPTRYKLPLSEPKYFNELKKIEELADKNQFVDPGFLHFKLYLHNLNSIKKNIKIYHTPRSIYTHFCLEQYAYSNGQFNIKAELGDYVIDAGACWGDTPLYFADLVGPDGKVYAFEFIDSNIEILKQNLKLNPELSKRIEIIKNPLHEVSGRKLYFIEKGPASRLSIEKPHNEEFEEVNTFSIDDFVFRNQIEKIDMIKMDIEGAEPYALKGALRTIRRFKPKLAIAIYHSESDFCNIPKWIHELNLDYKLFFDHFTIHREESIIFCSPNI